MLEFGDLELRGADVLLRPLRDDDAPALAWAAAESRDSYRFSPVPDGPAETEAYVERALNGGIVGERNARSRRAMERLGCTFEGIRRAHRPGVDCTVRNSAYYSVLAAEWPDVKDHLTRLLERR